MNLSVNVAKKGMYFRKSVVITDKRTDVISGPKIIKNQIWALG